MANKTSSGNIFRNSNPTEPIQIKKRTHDAVVTYSEILFANKLKEDVEILHRRADSVTHYAYLIRKALQ